MSFSEEEDGRLQLKRRPAVIVSIDSIKKEVCVVPLTSETRGATGPSSIVVGMDSSEGKRGGLRRDSVIDCSIVARVPTALIVTKIGAFSQETMARVEKCIRDRGEEL